MKIAIFTIIHDEQFYFPIWLDYYRKHLKEEDIYVIDHNSSVTPQSYAPGHYHVIKETHQGFLDHQWMRDTVTRFQNDLLMNYDVVVFAEVDEIIFYNNKDKTLIEAIEEGLMSSSYLTCFGIEPVQYIGESNDYCKDMNLVWYRKKYARAPLYDKTLISRVPLKWTLGFHECQYPAVHTPDFLLIHLHRTFYMEYMKRKIGFMEKEKAKENPNWGAQNKFQTMEEIERFYIRDYKEWEDLSNIIKVPLIL
jgi:hypothetical protein